MKNLQMKKEKILGLLAESNENTLSYKEIKEGLDLKSEPSSWLRNMVNKNLIVKKTRGKYQLRDKLFKEYLKSIKS